MKLGVLGSICLFSVAHAGPKDFTSEAREVYAIAACGEAPPAAYDAKVVAAHCKELATTKAAWKKNWYAKAAPFFAEHVTKAPTTVVYPFGGGDVITMLSIYPDATEYTSLSLEGIGDPRPIRSLAGPKLAANLGKLRKMLAANLGWAWNTTIQLSIDSSESGSGIPGILAIALVALDAHGYEPLEVRYFELGADGAVKYLSQESVDTFDAEQAKLPKGKRKETHALQHGLFNNVEITFRKKGDATAPRKVFRHIAADLSDRGLTANGAALAYIDKKPNHAAMTKAASYLFWKAEFSKIRTTFLSRMTIMVSDDTGIPPRYAKPAGFEQQVFGNFFGSYFKWADQSVAKEMVELWKAGKPKPLKFRFGYYDNRHNPHLMITRKATAR